MYGYMFSFILINKTKTILLVTFCFGTENSQIYPPILHLCLHADHCLAADPAFDKYSIAVKEQLSCKVRFISTVFQAEAGQCQGQTA